MYPTSGNDFEHLANTGVNAPLVAKKSTVLMIGIRPFLLIPFLRYTTSVLLQYCLDGRLSMLLPFLWDSYDSGTISP